MAEELTTEVLIQIRDEIKRTNERLERIEKRQTESEIRLASELVAVAGAVHELRDLLATDRELRGKVRKHEQRITQLEQRAACERDLHKDGFVVPARPTVAAQSKKRQEVRMIRSAVKGIAVLESKFAGC